MGKRKQIVRKTNNDNEAFPQYLKSVLWNVLFTGLRISFIIHFFKMKDQTRVRRSPRKSKTKAEVEKRFQRGLNPTQRFYAKKKYRILYVSF